MLPSKTNLESDVRKLKGFSRQGGLTNAQDVLGTWQVVQGLGENSLSEKCQSWLGQHFQLLVQKCFFASSDKNYVTTNEQTRRKGTQRS